jgi:hypothetical protein
LPDFIDVGTRLNNLAALYFAQSDWVRAQSFADDRASLPFRHSQQAGEQL